MSAENPREMTIKPRETILIETQDGFGGAIKRDDDLFPTVDMERVNQTTGPILMEGSEPGDTLVVEVRNIVLPKQGVTTIIPGFGALPKLKSPLRTPPGFREFNVLCLRSLLHI